jgi:uncharacterized protein (DUF169 family)
LANDQIINTIKSAVNIKKELVGIKAWKEEPQSVRKYKGNAFPGLCTQIGEVLKTGDTFHTNQEHCFCTGGVVATGVAPPIAKEERNEMLEAHFAMSKTYKDMDTAICYLDKSEKLIPDVGEKNAAVQLGLFKDMEDPDIILIFCTPGTADILNRAYCYTTGDPVQGFGGNGACPFAIQYPYVTKQPSFTYSDVAWRKYVGLADEELTISFPYQSLLRFIEDLPAVAEAYRKYGEVVEE